ncbi:endonuclease III [Candidatus Woesearchaeota archaeon]|nr:endonuclease III [Candidatus Woesearchaeota archaeon]
MTLEERKKLFLEVFAIASAHYKNSKRRLAGEGWKYDWQTLIVTIFSAQTRDEVTIPVCEKLFKKYESLKKFVEIDEEVLKMYIRPLNYYQNKAKYAIKTAKILLEKHGGKVPSTLEELIDLPGVGRKTANLIIGELFNKQGICVDTHVHRISNVLGLVKTKTPDQTEKELMKVAPEKYWNKINRIFVLWGQDVKGYDKDKFLEKIKSG